MGPGTAAGHTATTTATECAIAEGRSVHAKVDHAPTHGIAPRQSAMCGLPPDDGPARLRAGQFRWHRKMARRHGTRYGKDRFLRYPARWHSVQRTGRLAQGAGQEARYVR